MKKAENKNSAGHVILCGASAYEKKYFYNEDFLSVPESIREELHILCVLFTEEVGGVFTIGFDEEGNTYLDTETEEDDIYYDEVSSGLLIGEIQRSKRELLESLSLYYRVMILHEMPEDFAGDGAGEE